MQRPRPIAAAAVTALALVIAPATTIAPAAAAATRAVSAFTLLQRLPVRAESHASTSSRATSVTWSDADGDGDDTRSEVLQAESSRAVLHAADGSIEHGRWVSRYDGTVLTDASRAVVDHLVPLAEAWTSGAWRWSASKRKAYANDIGYAASLAIVSKGAVRARGGGEPSAYLPAKATNRCSYVRDWIAVKYRWDLSIDPREKATLKKALARCDVKTVAKPAPPSVRGLLGPGASAPAPVVSTAPAPVVTAAPAPVTVVTPAPVVVPVPTPVVSTTPAPAPAPVVDPVPVAAPEPAPVVSSTAPSASASSVYYPNCDAVRGAGAAPLHAGQPGYSRSLDRDGDGTACES